MESCDARATAVVAPTPHRRSSRAHTPDRSVDFLLVEYNRDILHDVLYDAQRDVADFSHMQKVVKEGCGSGERPRSRFRRPRATATTRSVRTSGASASTSSPSTRTPPTPTRWASSTASATAGASYLARSRTCSRRPTRILRQTSATADASYLSVLARARGGRRVHPRPHRTRDASRGRKLLLFAAMPHRTPLSPLSHLPLHIPPSAVAAQRATRCRRSNCGPGLVLPLGSRLVVLGRRKPPIGQRNPAAPARPRGECTRAALPLRRSLGALNVWRGGRLR